MNRVDQLVNKIVQDKVRRRRVTALWLALSVLVTGSVGWSLRDIGNTLTKEASPDAAHQLGANAESSEDWEATLPELTENWRENMVAIAQSQLGYSECKDNCTISDDETELQYYTRYGAWYGNPYGDWNAMFTLFCLHYSGIPESYIPYNSGCWSWSVQLAEQGYFLSPDEYSASAGDVIFFDTNDDGQSDRVGVVVEINETDEVSVMNVIEGDCDGEVAEIEYQIGDPRIIGYVSLKQPEYIFDGTSESGIMVHVAAEEGAFPDETTMLVTDVPDETAIDAVSGEFEDESDVVGAVAVDVSFYDKDGNEIEPADGCRIHVSITLPEDKQIDGEEFQLFHQKDDDEIENISEAEVTSDGASFKAESFSKYVITGSKIISNYKTVGQYVTITSVKVSSTQGLSNYFENFNNPFIMKVGETISVSASGSELTDASTFRAIELIPETGETVTPFHCNLFGGMDPKNCVIGINCSGTFTAQQTGYARITLLKDTTYFEHLEQLYIKVIPAPTVEDDNDIFINGQKPSNNSPNTPYLINYGDTVKAEVKSVKWSSSEGGKESSWSLATLPSGQKVYTKIYDLGNTDCNKDGKNYKNDNNEDIYNTARLTIKSSVYSITDDSRLKVEKSITAKVNDNSDTLQKATRYMPGGIDTSGLVKVYCSDEWKTIYLGVNQTAGDLVMTNPYNSNNKGYGFSDPYTLSASRSVTLRGRTSYFKYYATLNDYNAAMNDYRINKNDYDMQFKEINGKYISTYGRFWTTDLDNNGNYSNPSSNNCINGNEVTPKYSIDSDGFLNITATYTAKEVQNTGYSRIHFMNTDDRLANTSLYFKVQPSKSNLIMTTPRREVNNYRDQNSRCEIFVGDEVTLEGRTKAFERVSGNTVEQTVDGKTYACTFGKDKVINNYIKESSGSNFVGMTEGGLFSIVDKEGANTSSSKGSLTFQFNGVDTTFNYCLKMDSKGQLTFKAPEDGTIKLLLGDGTGSGTSYVKAAKITWNEGNVKLTDLNVDGYLEYNDIKKGVVYTICQHSSGENQLFYAEFTERITQTITTNIDTSKSNIKTLDDGTYVRLTKWNENDGNEMIMMPGNAGSNTLENMYQVNYRIESNADGDVLVISKKYRAANTGRTHASFTDESNGEFEYFYFDIVAAPFSLTLNKPVKTVEPKYSTAGETFKVHAGDKVELIGRTTKYTTYKSAYEWYQAKDSNTDNKLVFKAVNGRYISTYARFWQNDGNENDEPNNPASRFREPYESVDFKFEGSVLTIAKTLVANETTGKYRVAFLDTQNYDSSRFKTFWLEIEQPKLMVWTATGWRDKDRIHEANGGSGGNSYNGLYVKNDHDAYKGYNDKNESYDIIAYNSYILHAGDEVRLWSSSGSGTYRLYYENGADNWVEYGHDGFKAVSKFEMEDLYEEKSNVCHLKMVDNVNEDHNYKIVFTPSSGGPEEVFYIRFTHRSGQSQNRNYWKAGPDHSDRTGSTVGTHYDHADIEITDGATYTIHSEYTDSQGRKVVISRIYSASIDNIDYCDISMKNPETQYNIVVSEEIQNMPYYKDDANLRGSGALLRIPRNEYYRGGTDGATQFELTSKWQTEPNSQNAVMNGKDFAINTRRLFNQNNVKSADFHVNIKLEPLSEVVTVNGRVDEDHDPTDFLASPNINIDGANFVLDRQSVIDANNKCPDHSGLDFTITNEEVTQKLRDGSAAIGIKKVYKNSRGEVLDQSDGQFTFKLYEVQTDSTGMNYKTDGDGEPVLVSQNALLDSNAINTQRVTGKDFSYVFFDSLFYLDTNVDPNSTTDDNKYYFYMIEEDEPDRVDISRDTTKQIIKVHKYPDTSDDSKYKVDVFYLIDDTWVQANDPGNPKDSNDQQTDIPTFTNILQLYELPSTGSSGTLIIFTSGAVMLLTAGILYKKSRRKEDE